MSKEADDLRKRLELKRARMADPETAPLRSALRNLSLSLRDLHKALIEAARGDYVARHGEIASSQAFLRLLMEDEEFAWLRTLSGLIVEVDELVESALVAAQVADTMANVSALLIHSKVETPFSRRYQPYLESNRSVLEAHAAVERSLRRIPSLD